LKDFLRRFLKTGYKNNNNNAKITVLKTKKLNLLRCPNNEVTSAKIRSASK
jgi:hypothetical protein